jgi:hypothetical protein
MATEKIYPRNIVEGVLVPAMTTRTKKETG